MVVVLQERIERYNTCAKICKNVYKKLKELILQNIKENRQSDLNELSKFGDKLIQERCQEVYKNHLNKGIRYPVSISLNNCVSGYVYERRDATYKDDYNKIKRGDVVKIDLGVYIGDSHVIYGDTFFAQIETQNSEGVYLNLLERLKDGIKKEIKVGNVNDDVKMYIESRCSEYDCVPVENCTSHQQLQDSDETDEEKLIILNYQKYYDEEDRLILPNYCYEFEEGEIYDINLTIVKGEKSCGKMKHDSHIYRFNKYFYNLKLKASREFLKQCKTKNGINCFRIDEWNENPKWRIGIKECVTGGILEEYPILYEKQESLVFTKKFTIMVTRDGCFVFK